jgi:UDP-N-acetylglucosamine 2-epimerase (hydrolysing)
MKLLYISGTRADYGKLKPLIIETLNQNDYEVLLLATGMHMHRSYGYTYLELVKDNLCEIITCTTGHNSSNVTESIATLIQSLTYTVLEREIEGIVVHGDRPEALAGAMVGALNNIKVIHVEGGELSGTIDDSIRHAITKLSHIHLCNSISAKTRLIQLGENEKSIEVIGSPDLDILLSDRLPKWKKVTDYYNIKFDAKSYYVVAFHPVTTEFSSFKQKVKILFDTLQDHGDKNFIIIYPNNDLGSEFIVDEINKLSSLKLKNIFISKSFKFEYFLSILKNSKGLIGNSSAGMHEAPAIGLPVLNIGTRQSGRFINENLTNVDFHKTLISNWINEFNILKKYKSSSHYGIGNSGCLFGNLLKNRFFDLVPIQKKFNDIIE